MTFYFFSVNTDCINRDDVVYGFYLIPLYIWSLADFMRKVLKPDEVIWESSFNGTIYFQKKTCWISKIPQIPKQKTQRKIEIGIVK